MLVLISYAHGDVASATPDRHWVDRINSYFTPACRGGEIQLWWDKSIRPGEVWDTEIEAKLDEASVAILLVSSRFLASDYIYSKEMPRLLTRRSEGRMVFLPLILETCDLDAEFRYPDPATGPEKLAIRSLQGVNDPSKPLAALQTRNDDAVNEILKRLLARVREIRKQPGYVDAIRTSREERPVQKRVLVAGSGVPKKITQQQLGIAHALGSELAANGYGLVSGGWPGVDEMVTAAYIAEHERRSSSPKGSLVQVVRRGYRPPYMFGEVITVEPGDSEWVDQIVRSDAIVLIGGLGGTWTTGELGYVYGKPVLPLAATGGDAKEFYEHTLSRWEAYPMRNVSRAAFQKLSKPVPAVLDDVMDILRDALR